MARAQSIWLAALTCALCSSPVFAGDVFTGGQIDNKGQYVGYFGVRVPLAAGGVPLQPFIQVLGSGVGYTFTDQGRDRDVDFQSVTPSFGLKYATGSWSFLGSAGPQFRWTQSEQLAGGKDEATEVGVFVQGEAFYWHERGTLHAIGNYTDIDGFFWSRLRGTGLVHKRERGCCDTYLGWDVTGMGNRDFYAILTGPLVQVPIDRYWVTVRGGYQYTQTFQSGAYTGIELYFPF